MFMSNSNQRKFENVRNKNSLFRGRLIKQIYLNWITKVLYFVTNLNEKKRDLNLN